MQQMIYGLEELIAMLSAEGRAQRELHRAATAVREHTFGKRVVVRGVIELTNVCRVNCEYCPMRLDNTRRNETYILSAEEMLEAARAVHDAGLDIVFFQGGEIPQTTELVARVVPAIRRLFNDKVEILLCLGLKTPSEYRTLKDAGADSYIIKHETSDELLHARMRHESLNERTEAISVLRELGYRVGTGCIVGLPGQTVQSVANDILLAQRLRVDMSSASPFVPAEGTPLSSAPPGSVSQTLNAIAAMRLAGPNWLIPSVSALEQQGIGGQLAGLRAGANVMTINFTPNSARKKYLIYGPSRSVVTLEHVREQLAREGLTARGSLWSTNSEVSN